ncbi:MAG: acyl-CoA/acyl-ACP dehydrogenase [Bacteroidia bacterium]|nr:acyl-CoA/acyl-ACP dehydrogenase [Bacteroidia bacterium]
MEETGNPQWDALRNKVATLAREQFAPRAAAYDESAVFPRENFRDLQEAGLLAPLIARERGGLGLAHEPGGVFAQWMITREIGRADMGTARCWEGHLNVQFLLEKCASPEQKDRWYPGIIEKGEIWGSWSGEPQTRKPGENQAFGTHLTEVPGGYRLSGTKIFASGATGCDWAILFVSKDGPGAARHLESGPESLLMLACNLNDPTISYDDSWWDPIGMRASVSYLVRFDDTFIPAENLIGYPGQFLLEDWQTRLTPQYACTFAGGADAALEHTKEYIRLRKAAHDPYIQHRLARMQMNQDTCTLWLARTAQLWEEGKIAEAKLSGNMTRWQLEHLSMDTLQHAIHICGARALIKPSPLERIYRDISFYVRHDNADTLLASIGKSVLGIGHDMSFFTRQMPAGNQNSPSEHEA